MDSGNDGMRLLCCLGSPRHFAQEKQRVHQKSPRSAELHQSADLMCHLVCDVAFAHGADLGKCLARVHGREVPRLAIEFAEHSVGDKSMARVGCMQGRVPDVVVQGFTDCCGKALPNIALH